MSFCDAVAESRLILGIHSFIQSASIPHHPSDLIQYVARMQMLERYWRADCKNKTQFFAALSEVSKENNVLIFSSGQRWRKLRYNRLSHGSRREWHTTPAGMTPDTNSILPLYNIFPKITHSACWVDSLLGFP